MTGRGGKVALRVLGLVGVLLIATLLFTTPEVASKRGGPVPCPQIIGPAFNGQLGRTSPMVLAAPCPGNALSFAPSNILTIDHTFKGKDQTYPIRLWQNVAVDEYKWTWRSEDVTRYTDALIGDPDGDGVREIVALAWCDVQVGPKKDKVVERRVWLEAFETSSTGLPDFEGPEYFVIESGWPKTFAITNVDAQGPDEIVVLTSHRLALFTYDPNDGFLLVPGSVSDPVGPVQNHGDVGDVDGDGFPEVVVGTSDGDIYVWKWQGGGWTYSIGEAISLPLYIGTTRVGNVNGDGVLEIIGNANNFDTQTSYLFIWHYDANGQYSLQSSGQALDLAGVSTLAGLDLEDLDGDGIDELVFGTSGDLDNGQVGVLRFTGSEWTTLWSTTYSAVIFYAAAGDADGDPNTIELVFAGSTGGSLYLEVFAWAGGSASSSWSSIGDFGQANGLGLG